MKFQERFKTVKRPSVKFKKPTKTDISQQNSCDINNIMKKYAKTGVITHITDAIPQFGDISQLGDYQSCLEQISRANELFSKLPARARERFYNDPANFMTFMSDANNIEEAIKLGLAVARPQPPTDNTQTKPNDDLNDDKK